MRRELYRTVERMVTVGARVRVKVRQNRCEITVG